MRNRFDCVIDRLFFFFSILHFAFCTAVCGDGIIVTPEQCDDGNTLGTDGCSANCTLERGYVCPVVGVPCVGALQ